MYNYPKCVNIDWLEVYCLEPLDRARDISYFEACGYYVRDRGYGTKHMSEVFTILDGHGDDFIEVRRNPRNGGTRASFYPPNGCTLRFTNRYCYVPECVRIMLEFLEIHNYEIRRISRLDIALDFAQFDSGIPIPDFIRRVVQHKYVKIYQSDRTVRGRDDFNVCKENYIAWGNKKSMVATHLYNKTKEQEDTRHSKPWIIQQWLEAGIIDNPLYISKDGQHVDVWRLEFQIQSSARGWIKLDVPSGGDNYLEHTLELYTNKDGLWNAVKALAAHYFNFRLYKPDTRKYDCKQVQLFEWDVRPREFKLVNTAIQRDYDSQAAAALRTILRLKAQASSSEEFNALDKLANIYQSRALSAYQYLGTSEKILQLRMALAPEQITTEQAKEILKGLF